MSGYYPRGKLCEDDEGAVVIKMGVVDKTLIIDFDRAVTWLGFGKLEAIALANAIIDQVKRIKTPDNAQ